MFVLCLLQHLYSFIRKKSDVWLAFIIFYCYDSGSIEWMVFKFKNFNLIIYVAFHNEMISFFLFDMFALCFFEFSSDLFHLALDNIPLCV